MPAPRREQLKTLLLLDHTTLSIVKFLPLFAPLLIFIVINPTSAQADPYAWVSTKTCRIWTHIHHDRRFEKKIKPTRTAAWDGGCTGDKDATGSGNLTYFWDDTPLYTDHYRPNSGGHVVRGRPRLTNIPIDEISLSIKYCAKYEAGGWYKRFATANVPSRLDLSVLPVAGHLAVLIEQELERRCGIFTKENGLWTTHIYVYQRLNQKSTLAIKTTNPTVWRSGKKKHPRRPASLVLPLLDAKRAAGKENFSKVYLQRQAARRAQSAKETSITILFVLFGAFALVLLYFSPRIIRWAHYIFVPHPAEPPIKRATSGSGQPLDATALAQSLKPPARQTPPLRFVSENMARRAEVLRQRADAQRKRYEEEKRLADEAVEMERARRRRDDRRR